MRLIRWPIAVVLGIVQTVLGLHIALGMLGFTPASIPLIHKIHQYGMLFASPVQNMLHLKPLQSNGFVLDTSALLALIAYAVISGILLHVLGGRRR